MSLSRILIPLCVWALFPAVPGASHKGHKHPRAKAAPQKRAVKLHKRSIYQLNATWTNQDGKKIRFASLRGKVRVLAMIYASCPHACPVTISDLKRIESGIPANSRDQVGFVMITIDPKRDTPKKLKALAKKRSLDLKRWTLLNGNPNQVLEIAALLGYKYKKVSSQDFSHSNIITILDPKGVIKHKQVGLNQSPAQSLRVIKGLLKAKARGKRPRTRPRASR